MYPGTSRTLTSEYDRLNRLSKVTDSVGGKQTAYTYDANGNRRSCALPNGVTDTFTFDKLNRVATHQTNGGSIYNLSYAYDLVGNRRAITETVTGQAPRNLAYAYDAQYRLTSESWTGNSYTYSFDLAGNRLKLVQVAGANTFTTIYAYDRLNRLLSASKDGVATSYTYDLNGSRIQKQVAGGDTTAYAFDTLDRLATASVNGTPVFAASYDYRTRRLTKTEGGTGTYFRYDGGDSFHEVASGTTTIQVEFIRGSGMGGGIGSILYSDRVLSGGSDEYFTYNAVGHTVALTNGLGVATKTDLYEAYGGIVSSTGFSLNNRLANTKERDASIGLDNHGFRYFDPEVGRYLTTDPIQFESGFNWYAYASCNPINRIDPVGLEDGPLSEDEEKERKVLVERHAGGRGGPKEQGLEGKDLERMNELQIRYTNWKNKALRDKLKSEEDAHKSWLASEEGQKWLAEEKKREDEYDKKMSKGTPAFKAAYETYAPAIKAQGGITSQSFLDFGNFIVLNSAPIGVIGEIKIVSYVFDKGGRLVAKVVSKIDDATGKVDDVAKFMEDINSQVINHNGRGGKQARLKDLLTDPNVSAADKGWIKQEINAIHQGNRTSIRVPPGKNLAHRRGFEAKKKYDYKHSDLQDADLHKLQHKHEGY